MLFNEWQLLTCCTHAQLDTKTKNRMMMTMMMVVVFCSPHFLPLTCHSVSWAINNIFFIFFLDNDDIFIYVSFSLLIFEHTPHNNIVFIFGFCYFSLRSFLFIVENQLSFGIFDWLVGRSLGFTLIETMPMCVLHTMLKSYLKPYHFGEENWWWCYS